MRLLLCNFNRQGPLDELSHSQNRRSGSIAPYFENQCTVTNLTVFARWSSHDQALSGGLCVLVCVLPRYAFWKTVSIAELSKRTVQSACCGSGNTQSGRACGRSSVLLARLAQYSSSAMRRTNSAAARNQSRNGVRSTQVRPGHSNNSNKPHKHTRRRTSAAEIAAAAPPPPPPRSSFSFSFFSF